MHLYDDHVLLTSYSFVMQPCMFMTIQLRVCHALSFKCGLAATVQHNDVDFDFSETCKLPATAGKTILEKV